MNWKQFLKPDWRKMVLFVILLILSLLYEWPCTRSSVCRGLIFSYATKFFLSDNYDILWVQFVLNIVIWYLLSCLIVWIYDKFRKRKGNYVHIQNINMIMGQQKRNIKKK
jgi:membrane protein implicated in regulation of membrane protease activity